MRGVQIKIAGEEDYQQAVRALSARARPRGVLVKLMDALESYRQARKIGWSRPHNKAGMTIFATYQLNEPQDVEILRRAGAVLQSEFGHALDARCRSFLAELEAEPAPMGYVFVHDLVEGLRHFEGVTFSWGRRVRGEPRFRDRVDLLVESEIIAGRSVGLSRIRGYVDPFTRPIEKHPASAFCREHPEGEGAHRLFVEASGLHASWSGRRSKQWTHWTSDYISYFGPRSNPVLDTYFPTHVDLMSAHGSSAAASARRS